MKQRERLHHETRLCVGISHVAIRSWYNIPCSANLASADAPADRASLKVSDTLSNLMIDGMVEQIAS
jgi:hypothetical protein